MSEVLSAKQVKRLFPKRDDNANKGDYGYVALIGGCIKYSGAIRLAALAASSLRSGVGVSTIAAPKSLTDSILPNILESTFYPLSDVEGNMKFVKKEFDELMKRNDVIAFGMGIGNTEETQKALAYLLDKFKGTLVVDADGINAMAKLPTEKQKTHKCKLVLTPHPKEFSRLTKLDPKQVFQGPEKCVKEYAKEFDAIILLKGHRTYISDGKTTYAVDKGGPGMATAGSGDVLAGIVAALAASNKDRLLLATAGAAYINGVAGDLAAEEHGETSMTSGDSARKIEEAIRVIEENSSLVKMDRPKAVAPLDKPRKQKNPATKWAVLLGAILSLIICGAIWLFVLDGYDYLYNKDPREKQASYSTSLEFFERDIYIDGVLLNNYQLYRPFGYKDGKVFVPLTEDVSKALGYAVSYDPENPVELHLVKTEANHAGAFYDTNGWNLAKISGIALANVDIYIENGDKVEKLYPDVSEVLNFYNGNTIYIALRLLMDSETSGISAYYDNISGLYISTDKDIEAEAYYSDNNYKYVNGRIQFILSVYEGLDPSIAREYEYLFRHEANTIGLEEDFLIAMAWTESGFYAQAGSPAGAQGLMQIMPDTARANGMNVDNILDAHTNIQFGAIYINDALTTFKGNYIKALSAYNFGGSAVYSGAYDTGYANTVLARQEIIKKWITDNGYSNEFYTEVECTK